MERTIHRLTIHITDNDKFDKLVELDGLQPYAEALHNAIGIEIFLSTGTTVCYSLQKRTTRWISERFYHIAVPYKSCSETRWCGTLSKIRRAG